MPFLCQVMRKSTEPMPLQKKVVFVPRAVSEGIGVRKRKAGGEWGEGKEQIREGRGN